MLLIKNYGNTWMQSDEKPLIPDFVRTQDKEKSCFSAKIPFGSLAVVLSLPSIL
jgi:hypothetical protein